MNLEPFERVRYDNKTGKRVSSILDTIYNNILFFEDGIVVSRFNGIDCGNCEIYTNTQFLKNVSHDKLQETKIFYKGFNWGLYKVDGDTLKLQRVNHPQRFSTYWYLFEEWYLIKDNKTLEIIYIKDLIDEKIINPKPDRSIFHFVETNLTLKSNTWLKEEKWFWCDKK